MSKQSPTCSSQCLPTPDNISGEAVSKPVCKTPNKEQ